MNKHRFARVLLTLTAGLLIAGALSVITASASTTGTASVPSFTITLNGMTIDNASRKYPLLVYRDITYFPMTYSDCRFLGMTTEWSQDTGLVINKSDTKGSYYSDDIITQNKGKVTVTLAEGPVTINGRSIDNASETYPLFVYKNVTYFPLTWKYVKEEFGWSYYDYTDAGGLEIVSSASRMTSNGTPATSFMYGAEWYSNQVDGYYLMVPANIRKDESMLDYRAALSTDSYSLYIYRQDCGSAYGTSSFVAYNNAFTKDTVNFTVTDSGQISVNGRTATYNVWNRKPFTVVENDKYKYACFDIKDGNSVFTLYFKYNDSVSLTRDLMPVVNSFATQNRTASAAATHLGDGSGPVMNATAAAVYNRVFYENDRTIWGMFDERAVTSLESYHSFEKEIGYTFPIQLIYSAISESTPAYVYDDTLSNKLADVSRNNDSESAEASIEAALGQSDRLIELTLQTVSMSDGTNQVFAILRGEYDTFLHDYARQVAEYGGPVLFRLGNEMNGDWCPYSGYLACRDTDIYIEFYKYIFNIFQEEGADNCIWVWNPNGKSFPDYKWNSELMYYPGDEYVNVVGLTAYNTGTYYKGENWSTFDELYSNLYAVEASRYSQPLMITEFASSSVGGDKAAWINDMFDKLANYPRIKAAVWWNSCDYADYVGGTIARPYYLQESADIQNTFSRRLLEWIG